DAETQSWVTGLDQVMADKLAAVGLIPKRESATLDAFVGEFIQSRTDLKPGTKLNLEQARDWLVKYFVADRPLRDITAGDADGWWLHMLNEGLGQETAKRHVGRAKQLWKVALRRKLVSENVFIDLKSTVGANEERFYYVTRDEAQKVLDACPDAQ